MMNKRAFEMSVGMIVLIILSVLIFSMSLYFVFKWFGSAEELKAEIDKQTQEQIFTALKTGNQLVVIPVAVQQVSRGKSANFGIGIRNIGAEDRFSVGLSFSDAYAPDGRPLVYDRDFIEQRWLGSFNAIDVGLVKKNEQKVVPFLIKADINMAPGVAASKGDYIFNVCVFQDPLSYAGETAPCTVGHYNANAAAFYTGKIYQVTVKVV